MTWPQLVIGIVAALGTATLASYLAAKGARSIEGNNADAVRWARRAFFPGLGIGFFIVYHFSAPGPASAERLTVEPTPVIEGAPLRIQVMGLKYDDRERVLDSAHPHPSVELLVLPADKVDDKDWKKDWMPIGSYVLGEISDPGSGWALDVESHKLPPGTQIFAAVINFRGQLSRVTTTVEVKPKVE